MSERIEGQVTTVGFELSGGQYTGVQGTASGTQYPTVIFWTHPVVGFDE